jgi:hypothetical protein
MLKRQTLLLALAACFGLAQVANAAAIDVQFRDQGGDTWAMEMISDTPIGSTGIYIANADPTTGFASAASAPIIGLTGVLATINAAEDPTAPWGIFNATWFGLPAGVLINAGPGFVASDLGPTGTYLAMGMLNGVTSADIMAGQGMESGLWADNLGGAIPASDVTYTTGAVAPEPGALMLLGLGLAGLAFLRRR